MKVASLDQPSFVQELPTFCARRCTVLWPAVLSGLNWYGIVWYSRSCKMSNLLHSVNYLNQLLPTLEIPFNILLTFFLQINP